MSTLRVPLTCARTSGIHNHACVQALPTSISSRRCRTLHTNPQSSSVFVKDKSRDTQTRSFSSSLPSSVSFFERLGIFKKKDTDDALKGEKKEATHIKESVTEAISSKALAEQTDLMKKQVQQAPQQGDLSSSSIFNDELEVKIAASEEGQMLKVADRPDMFKTWLDGKHETRRNILESTGMLPNEFTYLRNVKLREIRRRGRLSKKETIARTEKSHLSKSHLIKTSIKKLGPLARQIQGKSLEHAMTQMRFSVKKASKSVLEHLQQVKAEAVVTKGFDVKNTYIEQAWVGRGTPAKEVEFRARGRVNMLTLPYTSISVVLKEEKTRQRIEKEREDRIKRRKPWQALPDKPIYGQHQYYTW